jgi:hypothetical protein
MRDFLEIFLICFSLFQQSSFCFGCFHTGSKFQNKLKKCFWVSLNQPKKKKNRLSFGLFRFEPKKKFDCFEDTIENIKFSPEHARRG